MTLAVFATATQKDTPTKAYWDKKYHAIAKMFATKNMDAFVSTLDPNFTYVDDKGKTYNRAEFIKLEVAPIKAATKVTGTVRVTSVAVKGDTVAVNYDWKYQVFYKSGKSNMKDVGEEIGTDTCHKVGNNWLTVKTTVKSAHDKTSKA